MPISLKEFVERCEAGEGAGLAKYDWTKVDELLAKGKPITIADAEAAMPEVKYRNQIRGYLERLVKSKTVVRTPKNQPRTFYMSKEVFEKFTTGKGKHAEEVIAVE